jgi:hypothetical protein
MSGVVFDVELGSCFSLLRLALDFTPVLGYHFHCQRILSTYNMRITYNLHLGIKAFHVISSEDIQFTDHRRESIGLKGYWLLPRFRLSLCFFRATSR